MFPSYSHSGVLHFQEEYANSVHQSTGEVIYQKRSVGEEFTRKALRKSASRTGWVDFGASIRLADSAAVLDIFRV